jgi:1,4-alpha-glucan branching enzyme
MMPGPGTASTASEKFSWAEPALAHSRWIAQLRSLDEHFQRTLDLIRSSEGSLQAFCFSNGLGRFGLQRSSTPPGWYYREWAPAAAACSLIGDFNGWDVDAHQCTRLSDGVFEVFVPDGVGARSVLRPGDRYKAALRVRSRSGGGQELVYRVPAWARSTQADLATGEICATVPSDNVFAFPWRHPQPASMAPTGAELPALRVYEVHVGISSSQPSIAGWGHFRTHVLPRVVALGYNALLLMAVQEHSYYASFGYQVTSFFAPSSRFGPVAELQALIDAAHANGLRVLIELVHTHASANTADGLNQFDGSDEGYFLAGADGWHSEWGTRMFDYSKLEVLRFLLSQVCYFASVFRVDGFRFDAVGTALFRHRSLGGKGKFDAGYVDYFGEESELDESALTYFKLANLVAHEMALPSLVTLAEEHTGFPGLCAAVALGGVGFDFRQAMGLPPLWVRILKDEILEGADEGTDEGTDSQSGGTSAPAATTDTAPAAPSARPRSDEGAVLEGPRQKRINVRELVAGLCEKRGEERRLAYVECHDQSIVGGQSLSFRLMGADMYSGMSLLVLPTGRVARGMALHKMSRLLTMALGGEGYLNFMGNEFGHPEWIDLPREGNGESLHMARRQWELADNPGLRYQQLQAFDMEMQRLHSTHPWLDTPAPRAEGSECACYDEERQLVWFRRSSCLFAFNFHSHTSATLTHAEACASTNIAAQPRVAAVALDSDDRRFGGVGGRTTASLEEGLVKEGGGASSVRVTVTLPPQSASVVVVLPLSTS